MKRYVYSAMSSSNYSINGKFNDNQLAQIEKGFKSGIDVSLYADPKFGSWQMQEIRKGLESEIDISWYADPKFDCWQMEQIRLGLKSGIDVSLYADPKFYSMQMNQIRLGLESGVDISLYADPKFDFEQMEQIRLGLESGVDASLYADPKFNDIKMRRIREGLEPGVDVSQSDNDQKGRNTDKNQEDINADKPKKSRSWKSLIAAISSESEDGIDSFDDQTEAGMKLEEICKQIESKMNLFLEPSTQGGSGSMFISDAKTNEELGVVDYGTYNNTVLDMAIASETKSAFQKAYKAYLESLI